MKHARTISARFALASLLLAAAAAPARAEDGYVQSYGAQSVNTGYKASGKTKVSIDFQLTQVKIGNDCVFGHYAKAGEFCLLLYCPRATEVYAEARDDTHASNARLFAWDNGTDSQSSSWAASDTERHVVVIDAPGKKADMYTPDGTHQAHLDFPSGWTYAKTSKFPMIFFGASKDANGTAQQCVYAKIYGVKVWETENGETSLVHDYVPAEKYGYAGFYDMVDGQFFGQQETSGTLLTCGGDVMSLGDDPYIENDGSAYSAIDTRYFPNNRTKVEVDFREMTLAKDNDIPFGHYSTADYSLLIYRPLNDSLVGTYKLVAKDLGYSGLELSPAVSADTRRHTAVIDIPGRHVEMRAPNRLVQGSASLASKTDWSWNFNKVTCPLMIFGHSTDAYGNSNQRIPQGRIYGVRIYENTKDDGSGEWTTVHDFKPCLKNGVPGLKDSETGMFISGGNITASDTTPEEDETDPYIDTTTANAAVSFDTGYDVSSNTCVVCDYRILKQKAEQQFLFEVGDSGTVNDCSFMRVYANGDKGTGGISYACGRERYVKFNDPNGIHFSPNVRRTATLDAYNRKVRLEADGETIWEGDLTEAARVPDKSQKTLKIFSDANGTSHACMARLFGFKIYEEGILVRDYRPYVKNGAIGLRDVVGDGGFITATKNVGVLRCGGGIEADGSSDAYIENDGTTVLNLGYKANMTSRIEFDFQWLRLNDGGEVVCGAWNTGTLRYCFWHYKNDIEVIFSGNSKSYQTIPGIAPDFMRHTAVLDMKNRSIAYVTGGVSVPFTVNPSAPFNATDESVDGFGVFDGIKEGIAQGMTSYARVYAVRIYENDALVHEFLPYRNGDTVSLYDTKTGNVATKTAKSGVSNPAWPTIGGMGVDGAEKWLKALPATATISKDQTITLTAAAAGAIRYEWTLNGEVLEGETGESVSVAWRKAAEPDVYSCTPIYDVFGVETRGTPVSCAVTHLVAAFMMVVR